MGDADREEIRRALAANAVKARSDAARYAESLEDKPFWRWRRRKQISRAMLNAEHREQAALRLLSETDADAGRRRDA